LNNVVKAIRFKINISEETSLDKFLSILNNLTGNEKQNFVDFLRKNNVNLFLEYLKWQAKSELKNEYSLTKIKEIIYKNYCQKYFENSELENKFYNFYCSVKENIDKKYHAELSEQLLLYWNEDKFLTNEQIMKELKIIDVYLTEYPNPKIEMNWIIKKYSDFITERIPYLYSIKIKEELLKCVTNGTFDADDEKLHSLNKDSKMEIFNTYMLSLSKIGKFDLTFAKYLPIIEKHFESDKLTFWEKFFKNKNKEDDNPEYHTLSFLERKFIVSILETDNKEYHEIISKLLKIKYFDNFDKPWLIDHFRNTGKPEYQKIIEQI
jgi:hypothetical protein